MKTKILGEKMLAQCPICNSIKMETNSKYQPVVYQKSIVTFDNLPKEPCYTCSIK